MGVDERKVKAQSAVAFRKGGQSIATRTGDDCTTECVGQNLNLLLHNAVLYRDHEGMVNAFIQSNEYHFN